MVDLTVLILTKNEEKNLKKCIESFGGIVKRFVIVDSGSTDNTVQIAKELGADVYYNPWVDYATQLNWGLKNTQIDTAWTMRMDADEELMPKLRAEIEEKLPNMPADINGIELKRRVYFLGKWIKHGGVYPTILLRIFRTGMCVCEQTIMDEHLILSEGKTIRFKNDFIDNNTKDLQWWIDKHNWYSDREMQDYYNKQTQLENNQTVVPKLFGTSAERKRWFKYKLYYKIPMMMRARLLFFFRYYIKLGFLDGKEGRIFHFLQGYWYRFLIDAKIYEREKNRKKENIDQGNIRV